MGTVNDDDKHGDAATAEREPYEPPAIVYREPLEAVAVGCQPAPPNKATPGACPQGVLSS